MRQPSVRAGVIARLIGWALELPPAVYVALNGEAPGWVRVWFICWLSLFIGFHLVTALVHQVGKQTPPVQTAEDDDASATPRRTPAA